MEEYFCNSCLEQFKPGDQGAGLRCAHLLCRKCSEKELASQPLACPVCRTSLEPSDIHIVGMQTTQEDASTLWSLVGKSSQTAMDVAHFSFQFAVQQAEMYATTREQQRSEEKISRMNEACKTRMTDLYQGYKKAKRKVQELVQHGQEVEAQLQAENEELRAKYNQKDSEAQALRQKLPLLQQENDDLRQTCMQLTRQAGVNPNQIPLLKTGGGAGNNGGGGGGHFGIGGGNSNNMQLRRSSFPALPGSSPQAAGGGGGFCGGGGHLGVPPPRRPSPSPFISPTTSHGNGMDSFTPIHASVQRQALLHSGSRPQLGATLLRGGGSGGGGGIGAGGGDAIVRARPGSGGGGIGGGMAPPGVRLPISHNMEDVNPNTRRSSLVPMGLPPRQQQQQQQQHGLGFGSGFHQGGGNGSGVAGHPGYY
ncbi:hypothetical protein Ndes2437B_g00044 [Nannochloris sp. 'desiccata']